MHESTKTIPETSLTENVRIKTPTVQVPQVLIPSLSEDWPTPPQPMPTLKSMHVTHT